MPELPPALPVIPSLVAAGGLYLAIWFAAGRIEGAGAKALARALPLLVMLPAVLWLYVVLTLRHEEADTDAAAPPARTSRAAAQRPVRAKPSEAPWRPVKSDMPR